MNNWINLGTADENIAALAEHITTLDPRPVKEQIAENYGSYRPFAKKDLRNKDITEVWSIARHYCLSYPGDPLYGPRAWTIIHGDGDTDARFNATPPSVFKGELVILYEFDLVGIFQPDGEFDVVRLT